MLPKWKKKRPTKFTGDYFGLPSRWDLVQGLSGMYNACWGYAQVAEQVGRTYETAERQFRAEMITSSLIAHRRTRMVSGQDGIDFSEYVQQVLKRLEQRKVSVA